MINFNGSIGNNTWAAPAAIICWIQQLPKLTLITVAQGLSNSQYQHHNQVTHFCWQTDPQGQLVAGLGMKHYVSSQSHVYFLRQFTASCIFVWLTNPSVWTQDFARLAWSVHSLTPNGRSAVSNITAWCRIYVSGMTLEVETVTWWNEASTHP